MSTPGEQSALVGDRPDLPSAIQRVLQLLQQDLGSQCTTLDDRLKEKIAFVKSSLAASAPQQGRGRDGGGSAQESGGDTSGMYRDPVPSPFPDPHHHQPSSHQHFPSDSTQPGLGGGASFFLEMVLGMMSAQTSSEGSGSGSDMGSEDTLSQLASAIVGLVDTPGTRNHKISPHVTETLLRHFKSNPVGKSAPQRVTIKSSSSSSNNTQQEGGSYVSTPADLCHRLRLMAAIRSGQLEKVALCLGDTPVGALPDPAWGHMIHQEVSRGRITFDTDDAYLPKDGPIPVYGDLYRFLTLSSSSTSSSFPSSFTSMDVSKGVCMGMVMGHAFVFGNSTIMPTVTNNNTTSSSSGTVVAYISPSSASNGTFDALEPQQQIFDSTPSPSSHKAAPAKVSPQLDNMFVEEDGTPIHLHLQKGPGGNTHTIHATQYLSPSTIYNASSSDKDVVSSISTVSDPNSLFTLRSVTAVCGDKRSAYLVALREAVGGRRGSLLLSHPLPIYSKTPMAGSQDNKAAASSNITEAIQCVRHMYKPSTSEFLATPPTREVNTIPSTSPGPKNLLFNSKSYLNCGGFDLGTQTSGRTFTVELFCFLLSLPSSTASDPPTTTPLTAQPPDGSNHISTTTLFQSGHKDTEQVFIDIHCDRSCLVLRGGHRTPTQGVCAAIFSLDLPRKFLKVWNHIALTYTGCKWLLTLNGVLVASREAFPHPTDNNVPPTNPQGCTLGRGCVGSICELRIWSIPLSINDIKKGMGVQLSGTEAGLVGYFPIDEGHGHILADYSPIGRHAYLPKDSSIYINAVTTTSNSTSPGLHWTALSGAPPCASNPNRPVTINDFVPSLLATASGREVSVCICESSLVVAVPTDTTTVQIFVYRRDCGCVLEQELTIRIPDGWVFQCPVIDSATHVLTCLLLPKATSSIPKGSSRVALRTVCSIAPALSPFNPKNTPITTTNTMLKWASEKAIYLLSAWNDPSTEYPTRSVVAPFLAHLDTTKGNGGGALVEALGAVSPLRSLRCQFTDVSSLVLDPTPLTLTRLVAWAVQLRLQWLQKQQAVEAGDEGSNTIVGNNTEVDEIGERLRQLIPILCLNIQAIADRRRGSATRHLNYIREEEDTLSEAPCTDAGLLIKQVKATQVAQTRLTNKRTPFLLPRPPLHPPPNAPAHMAVPSTSTTSNAGGAGGDDIPTLSPLRQLQWLCFTCFPANSTNPAPPRLLMHSLPLLLTEEAMISYVIRIGGRRAPPTTTTSSNNAPPSSSAGNPLQVTNSSNTRFSAESTLYDACVEYLTPLVTLSNLSHERLLSLSAALFAEAASSEMAKQVNTPVVRTLQSILKLLSSRFLNSTQSQREPTPSAISSSSTTHQRVPVITFAVQLFKASETSIASCTSSLRRGEMNHAVQLISEGYIGQLVPLLCLVLPQHPTPYLVTIAKAVQQLREGLQGILSYCGNGAGSNLYGRSGSVSSALSDLGGSAIVEVPGRLSSGASSRAHIRTLSGLANSLLLAWSQLSVRLIDTARSPPLSSSDLSSATSLTQPSSLGGKYAHLFRGGLQRVGAQRDAALKSLNQGVGAIGRLLTEIQQESIGLRAKDTALIATERALFGAFCAALLPTTSLVSPTKEELTHIFSYVKGMRQWILSERQQDPQIIESVVKKATILCRFEPCVVDARWAAGIAQGNGGAKNDLRSSINAMKETKALGAVTTVAPSTAKQPSNRQQWRNTFTVWKAFRQLRSLVATLKGGDDISETKAAQLLIDFLQDKSMSGNSIEAHVQQMGGIGAQVLEGLSSTQRIIGEFSSANGGRVSRTVMHLLMRAFCGWHYLDGLQGCPSEVSARVRGVYFHVLDSVLKEGRTIQKTTTSSTTPSSDSIVWTELALSMLATSWVRSDFIRLSTDIPTFLLKLCISRPRDLSPNPTAALPISVASAQISPDDCAPSISVGASGLVLKGTGLRGSALCRIGWSEASEAMRRSLADGTPHKLPYTVLFFEVLLVDVSPSASVTVGVGPTDYNLFRPPGWEAGSFAVQDDGMFFCEKSKGVLTNAMSLGNGDVLGCGWNIATGKLFWTHNDKKLPMTADVATGYLFGPRPSTEEGEFHPRSLCPLVGIDSKCLIQLNFGAEPFVFDLASLGVRPVMLLGQRSWAVLQLYSLNVATCYAKSTALDDDISDDSSTSQHDEPLPSPSGPIAANPSQSSSSPSRSMAASSSRDTGSEDITGGLNRAMVQVLLTLERGLTEGPASDDSWVLKIVVLLYQVFGAFRWFTIAPSSSSRTPLPLPHDISSALCKVADGLVRTIDYLLATPTTPATKALSSSLIGGGISSKISDSKRNVYLLLLKCLHRLLMILPPDAMSKSSTKDIIGFIVKVGEVADVGAVSRQPIGWLAIRILRQLNRKGCHWQQAVHSVLLDRLVQGRDAEKRLVLLLPLGVLGGGVFPLPGDTVLRRPKMFSNGTLLSYSLDDEIAFTRPDVESQSNKHALQMGEVGSHAFLNASRAAVQAEVVEKEWFASDDPLHHQQLQALLTTADQLWSSWSAVPLVEAGGGSGAMVLKPAQGGPDTSNMLAVHVRLLRCLNNATTTPPTPSSAAPDVANLISSIVRICATYLPMFTHWVSSKNIQSLSEDEAIHSAVLRELPPSGRRLSLVPSSKSPVKTKGSSPSPTGQNASGNGTPSTTNPATSSRTPPVIEGDTAAVEASRLRIAQELSMQGFSLEMCMFALEQTYYDRVAALRMLLAQQEDIVWYEDGGEEEEEHEEDEEHDDMTDEEGDEEEEHEEEEDDSDMCEEDPDDDGIHSDEDEERSTYSEEHEEGSAEHPESSNELGSDHQQQATSSSDQQQQGCSGISLKVSSFLKLNAEIVLGHQYSIDIWLRIKDIDKPQLVLWQKGPAEARIMITDRTLKFGWWDAEGHGREQCCFLDLTSLDVGVWTRFTFVQDLDQLHIYKGASMKSFVISPIFDCLGSSFCLGGSARFPSQTLLADIRDIRIFDCALSADGVRSLSRMCPRGTEDSIGAIHLKCTDGQLPLVNAACAPSLITCTVEVHGPGLTWVQGDGQITSSGGGGSPVGTGRRALYPGVLNTLVPTIQEVDLTTQPDTESLFAADVPVDYDTGMGAQLRELRKLSYQQCASRYASIAQELCSQFACRVLLGVLALQGTFTSSHDFDTAQTTDMSWIGRIAKVVCDSPDESLHTQAASSITALMKSISQPSCGKKELQKFTKQLEALLVELREVVKVPHSVATFESSHPAKVLTEPPKAVSFPNQQHYDLYFDKKGVSGNVLFTFYTDHTLSHVIAHHSGYSLRIKAKKFFFDVRIDGAGPQWGYKMSIVYNGAKQTVAANLLRLVIQEGCAVVDNIPNPLSPQSSASPLPLRPLLSSLVFSKATCEALLVGVSVSVAKCRRTLLAAVTHALRHPWMFLPDASTNPSLGAIEDSLPVFHQLTDLRKHADKQYRQELGLSIHSKFIQAVMQLSVAVRDAERSWETAIADMYKTTTSSSLSPLRSPTDESADPADDANAFLARRREQKKQYASRIREGSERVELVKQGFGERLRIEQSPEKTFHAWSEHLRATAIANVAMAGGQWYFEVRMVAAADVSIGVMACNPSSIWSRPWGLNGRTGAVLTADCRVPTNVHPRRWKVKDVVGVVIDADTRQLRYYVNGVPLDITVDFGTAVIEGADVAASAGYTLDDNDMLTTFTLDPTVGLSPWFALGPEAAITVNFGSSPFDMEIPPGCLPLDSSNLGVGSLVPFNQLRAFEEVMLCVAGGHPAPPFFSDEHDTAPSDAFRQGPTRISIVPEAPGIIEDVCNEITLVGNRFSTVKTDVSVMGGGRWYYEVTVITQGLMQIGWATTNSAFSPHDKTDTTIYGVGDTKDSIGVDLYRSCLWQFGNRAPLTQSRRWASGDVIGCGLDLDAREVFFTCNGRGLARASAHAFRSAQVCPAISLRPGNVVSVNFGMQPLKYKPEGYNALGVPDTWLERVDTYFGTSNGSILQRRLMRLAELANPKKGARLHVQSEAYREFVSVVDNMCLEGKKDVLQLKEEAILAAVAEAAITSDSLKGKTLAELSSMFVVLNHLCKLTTTVVPLIYFDLYNAPLVSKVLQATAPHYIWHTTREAIVARILKETNSRSDHFRITINRSKAKGTQVPFTATVFGQTLMLLADQHPRIFKTSKRFWTVNFVGEGAEDAGGPFREHISDICAELMSDTLPLFVPTANNVNNAGECREGFVPRAGATSLRHATMFRFVGRMMGGALRNGEPLNLYLPRLFWKKLLRCPVSLPDVASVDQTCVQCILEFASLSKYGEAAEEVFDSTFEGETFTTTLSDSTLVNLIPDGAQIVVTYNRCKEYADALTRARLDEFDRQVEWIREGVLNVVPEIVLALMQPHELEARTCGKPDYMVSELKADTVYEGLTAEDRRVKFMWQVLEEATPKQRRLFLRFVSGRERLPVKLRVLPFVTPNRDPNSVFPKAATCFFAIEVPDYTTVDTMRHKLIYTVENCAEIDTDFRARETDEDGPLLHIGSEDRPEDDPSLTVPE